MNIFFKNKIYKFATANDNVCMISKILSTTTTNKINFLAFKLNLHNRNNFWKKAKK